MSSESVNIPFDGAPALLVVLCSVGLPVLVFALFGGFLMRRFGQAQARRRAAQGWLRTHGVVVTSELQRLDNSDSVDFSPRVSYSYTVGGQQYVGATIRAGEDRLGPLHTKRSASAVVARYPPGARVAVFYDPNDPSRSALER